MNHVWTIRCRREVWTMYEQYDVDERYEPSTSTHKIILFWFMKKNDNLWKTTNETFNYFTISIDNICNIYGGIWSRGGWKRIDWKRIIHHWIDWKRIIHHWLTNVRRSNIPPYFYRREVFRRDQKKLFVWVAMK